MVPFTSGPFNWDDYHNGKLLFLPWSLAHRDQGVLYDHDGIRLEVLDYLSNSEIVNLPSLAFTPRPLGRTVGELPKQTQVFDFRSRPMRGRIPPATVLALAASRPWPASESCSG